MRETSIRLSLGLLVSLTSTLFSTPSFAQTTHEFEATDLLQHLLVRPPAGAPEQPGRPHRDQND